MVQTHPFKYLTNLVRYATLPIEIKGGKINRPEFLYANSVLHSMNMYVELTLRYKYPS